MNTSVDVVVCFVCSCQMRHAAENMKRYPEMAAEYVRAEMKIQHT